MKNMETHVGKMEKQLKHWGARLDEVAAEAEKAGSEVKVDCNKNIDELKAKYKAAQSRLHAFRASGSKNWESFKTDVESAWNELEVDFKKLTS